MLQLSKIFSMLGSFQQVVEEVTLELPLFIQDMFDGQGDISDEIIDIILSARALRKNKKSVAYVCLMALEILLFNYALYSAVKYCGDR